MSKKDVNDYLKEGIYGTRRPKEAERAYYLGTLRERIVLALTKGQVMRDKSLTELEQAMQDHPETKLLINGSIGYRFLKAEKDLAEKYNIPYTIVTHTENETDIGAVLTYDYAIDKEDIFVKDDAGKKKTEKQPAERRSLFSKIISWFKPSD